MVSTKTSRRSSGTSFVWFMALAAALGTATIYPLQPAIAEVSDSLGTGVAAVGAALALGPIGYLVGLISLVPLVDRFRPDRVVSAQFGALAAALAIAAFVGSVWAIGALMLIIGACSSVGAGLSSVASRVARPERRSTFLGIVTAGISAGILAGRIVGGWLTDLIGWQPMLGVFAVACAAIAMVGRWVFPTARGTTQGSYLAVLASMPGLLRRHRVLRTAALAGSLWFFAFCAVWAGIAVALSAPPFSFSAETIGLYGLAGLAGIFATRVAGAWTDRVGPRPIISFGLATALLSCCVLAVSLPSPAVTLAALASFDAGLFAAQVANQSRVLAIDPGSPARYNSTYMVVYFVGGSVGTAFGAASTSSLGWAATAVVCAVAIIAAMMISRASGRRSAPDLSADAAV